MILLLVSGVFHLEVNRRDWMLHILRTTSAMGVLTPALLAQEHAHAGMADAVKGDAATSWGPHFFSAEQNSTVIALGERIIPGSTDALCNRLIDSILLIDSEKNKNTFLQFLAAFDGEAQGRYHRPFRELSPAQQDEILSAASQNGAPLYRPFETTKEWIADAYWTSQTGLRELGWTGRLAWDSFPNCGSAHPHN